MQTTNLSARKNEHNNSSIRIILSCLIIPLCKWSIGGKFQGSFSLNPIGFMCFVHYLWGLQGIIVVQTKEVVMDKHNYKRSIIIQKIQFVMLICSQAPIWLWRNRTLVSFFRLSRHVYFFIRISVHSRCQDFAALPNAVRSLKE